MCEHQVESFEKSFNSFLDRRVFEELAALYLNNEKSKQLRSEIQTLYEKLKTFVREESKEEFSECFNNYENAYGDRNGLDMYILYLQGLKDGIKLGHILEIGKECLRYE